MSSAIRTHRLLIIAVALAAGALIVLTRSDAIDTFASVLRSSWG